MLLQFPPAFLFTHGPACYCRGNRKGWRRLSVPSVKKLETQSSPPNLMQHQRHDLYAAFMKVMPLKNGNFYKVWKCQIVWNKKTARVPVSGLNILSSALCTQIILASCKQRFCITIKNNKNNNNNKNIEFVGYIMYNTFYLIWTS